MPDLKVDIHVGFKFKPNDRIQTEFLGKTVAVISLAAVDKNGNNKYHVEYLNSNKSIQTQWIEEKEVVSVRIPYNPDAKKVAKPSKPVKKSETAKKK